jgi:hypothetical protein
VSGDESRIVAAQLAVEECYEQVTINPLPSPELEDLRQAHLPTDEQRKRLGPGILFNPDTFVPALLAACVDSDVTEEDWYEYITTGVMTSGEINALWDVVWGLNYRPPDPTIPKG